MEVSLPSTTWGRITLPQFSFTSNSNDFFRKYKRFIREVSIVYNYFGVPCGIVAGQIDIWYKCCLSQRRTSFRPDVWMNELKYSCPSSPDVGHQWPALLPALSSNSRLSLRAKAFKRPSGAVSHRLERVSPQTPLLRVKRKFNTAKLSYRSKFVTRHLI